MPNRIIKESIARSERVNALTDFQFRLWAHLLIYVDDYGRGDARPAIIKGACFPLRDRLSNKDIEKGLADLAGAGCVVLYQVDGKPYLYFPNWEEHQRVRTKVSKYPAPEEGSILPQSAADGGEVRRGAARIQSESNTESESRIQNPNDRAEDFERFWKEYPRKVNKQGALNAFLKIDEDIAVLLEALKNHKRSAQWTKDGGAFIPHPTTWLNQKRWEEELVPDQSIPKGASGTLGEAELEAIRRALEEGA